MLVEIVEEAKGQLRIAGEVETIGDYVERLLKLNLKMINYLEKHLV